MQPTAADITCAPVDQQQQASLADLDESVLIHILAWLPNPQPLAAACSALHTASSSSMARALWFQRHYPSNPVASQRPLVLAALSWHGVGEDTQLLNLVVSTARHLQRQQLPYQLPSQASIGDASRTLHNSSSTGTHLKLLQQLTPWHEHLLMPAVAAAGHHALLQQVLANYGPPASADSSAAGSSSSRCFKHTCSSSSSSSSNSLQDGARRLQLWLWCGQHIAPAIDGQLQQQQQQQTSPRVRWGRLVQPLPDFPGFKAFRHNVLQTSLLAAAQGGSSECLQLLLGQLVCCRASVWDCAEVLTTVAEAAAAAGSLDCLQLVWQVLQPPAAATLKQLQQEEYEQQQQQQQEHAAVLVAQQVALHGQQSSAASLPQQQQQQQQQQLEAHQQPQHSQQEGHAHVLMQMQLQQLHLSGTAALAHHHLEQQLHLNAPQLPQQQQLHLNAPLPQQQQQQQQQQPLHLNAPQPQQQPVPQHQPPPHHQQQQQHPAQTALQWVGASTYLLVAAASSGCVRVMALVMLHMQVHMQKQQLPAALSAAGQRGHVAALQLLLQHPELSSRPLQLAASDAAIHGWPPSTLAPLLQCMAGRYHQELISLLAKPLVLALQQRRQEVVESLLDVLVREAALDQGDLLADALLLLAYQGQTDRVAWIIRVAPTVLVKLGPRAAAAALEGGHPRLAQLILDRGGERPPTFKAAAKRGELTAAVAAGDAAAVQELLHQVRLPLAWACEAAAVWGQGGPGQGGQQVYGGAAGAPLLQAAGAVPAGAVPAGGAGRQTYPTHCLLTLLKSAAVHLDVPASVDILRQLLWVLTDSEGQSSERQHVLMAVAKACLRAGRAEQLGVVVEAAGRPRGGQRRPFLRELRSHLQLPSHDESLLLLPRHRAAAAAASSSGSGCLAAGSSSSSSSGGVSVSAAGSSSCVLAAAMTLMEQPLCSDLVSSLLAQSYFDVCMGQGEYLGSTVRPMQPAVHIPSVPVFTQLLLHLAQQPELPPGARCRDLPLFRLLVRTVLQSGDVYLLHALLLFMQRHGTAVMADMPEDALRALRVEAEAVQAAEGRGPAQHGAVEQQMVGFV